MGDYFTPKNEWATGIEDVVVGEELACFLKAGKVKCIKSTDSFIKDYPGVPKRIYGE